MKAYYKVNLVKTYFFYQKWKACISVSVRPGFHMTGAQLENRWRQWSTSILDEQTKQTVKMPQGQKTAEILKLWNLKWKAVRVPMTEEVLDLMAYWGCFYRVQEVVGADSPWAHTSRRGKCLESRSPPTGRTHPPNHQSGWAAGGPRTASPWPHTEGEAPSDLPPPVSCWGKSRDLGSPDIHIKLKFSSNRALSCKLFKS